MAKRCDTRICRKGHRPLWRILPSGTPTEPVPLRLPTGAELNTERLSWSSNDQDGALASPLKISSGGRRNESTGVINSVGNAGGLWSSDVDDVTITQAKHLNFAFFPIGAVVAGAERASGFNVRLIVDGTFTQQEFDDSYSGQTITIHGLNYGYVYNSTTDKIWLDRNLGATKVATALNDQDSFGGYYQWGRGTDGHQIRTSTTTGTLSGSDDPGNDSFILAPDAPKDWRDPQNDNLWQGVNGINNPAN